MRHAARPTDLRTSRLAAGTALVVALFAIALSAAPDPAAAQTETVCVPNGDGTYTPVVGGPQGPGSIVIGPGESCPTTLAEEVPPPQELPAEPECPACPEEDKKKDGSGTGTSAASAATPASYSGGSEQLPFTGGDEVRLALLLGGVGLLAVAFGLGLRRRVSRPW